MINYQALFILTRVQIDQTLWGILLRVRCKHLSSCWGPDSTQNPSSDKALRNRSVCSWVGRIVFIVTLKPDIASGNDFIVEEVDFNFVARHPNNSLANKHFRVWRGPQNHYVSAVQLWTSYAYVLGDEDVILVDGWLHWRARALQIDEH